MEELGLSALGGKIEKEHEEKEEPTAEIAIRVADILRKSNYSVIYTGAGVSTSTGISDYRGPNGVWTTLAEGRIPDEQFDLTSAQPSFTHMAITKLVEVGLVKFVTSTNLDGLHYKSGLVPLDNLAELHGSMFVERCCRCSKDFLRPFPIRRGGASAAGLTTHPRITGRNCTCGGSLMDSGIDFGQTLPLRHLGLAEQHAKQSDFSLVLGTSLRVAPASELPFLAPSSCIVNMMSTPKDEESTLRSYGKSDLFFLHLMRALELEVDAPTSSPHAGVVATATEMKRKAVSKLPVRPANQYVGKAVREREMAVALFCVEKEMLC